MKSTRHTTRLFVCLLAVALAIAGIAFATPIVGLLTSIILANGNTTTSDILVRSRVALPPAPGQEPGEDDDNEWSGLILLHGPTNVQVQSFSYDVNGHTGWHSHPGMLVFTVVSGTIEWYDVNTTTHYFRNVGAAKWPPSPQQCSASALSSYVHAAILTDERSLHFQLRRNTRTIWQRDSRDVSTSLRGSASHQLITRAMRFGVLGSCSA